MAIGYPGSGYITNYGTLTLHDPTAGRWAASSIRALYEGISQLVELPDGRTLDLAQGEITITIPSMIRQRYYVERSGLAYLQSVEHYILTSANRPTTMYSLDRKKKYKIDGRMMKASEVSPVDVHDGAEMVIECIFQLVGNWMEF